MASKEFRTGKAQEYRTTPTEMETDAVSLNLSKFRPHVKRTKDDEGPDAYLIIGFDTEYQGTEAATAQDYRSGKAEAKNEVLSYQFCVRLVTIDEEGDCEVSGIIIPEENARISIEGFVVYAIGKFQQRFPAADLPTDIYLTGHFTRADLPGFLDFAVNAREIASNIRNTFVSVSNYTKLHVEGDAGTDPILIRLRMRDTLLLAPGNAKRLEAIGDIVGFPKLELSEDPTIQAEMIQNMKRVRQENWELFREYGIRDAEVCVKYAERIMRQHLDLFGQFSLPVTLTSFGTKLVLQSWKNAGLDEEIVLGREMVTEKRFSKSSNRMKTVKERRFIEELFYELDFVTASYHGGRNEQFMFGIAPEGEWRDLDLSSAYTTAMSIIGLPKWQKLTHIFDLKEIGMDDLAFASVDFEFPESVSFPVLPVRTPNGIIFPQCGRSVCAAPEIWLAQKLGAKLTLRRAIKVPMDRRTRVFSDFISDCIKRRQKTESGTFDNLFWKEVGNSTYGKTAQGLRKKRVYDLREDGMADLPESRITQPFFASFITSYTRAVLGEILNSLPSDVHVFSVTTDGFLSTVSDEQRDRALQNPLAQSFQKARKALVGNDQVLEEKHKVRQPIGWRTRGSATLVTGVDEEKNIVLQKGGIRVPRELRSVREENDYIVDLFIRRQPDDYIQFETGLGIRDMANLDADFVSRIVTKQLRMEFDWKRTPIKVAEVTGLFRDQAVRHLSFDTKPVADFDEFSWYRDAWDELNKGSKICLKSQADYDDFLVRLSRQKQPKRHRRRTLKKDGDLNHLKQDLCRAWRHRAAGFELLPAHRKIPHAKFAETLSECGVPCSIADLDNAKRNEFRKHRTPRTSRVVDALTKLKNDHFPELVIEEFLDDTTSS